MKSKSELQELDVRKERLCDCSEGRVGWASHLLGCPFLP